MPPHSSKRTSRAGRLADVRLSSDLNLDGQNPLRAQPARGAWGPLGVPGTRWKKFQRILVPVVTVAIATGLFFLGRMFYLILTGQ